MPQTPVRTICLLGREPGLRVLEWLLDHPSCFGVAAVWTHRLRPTLEDPVRSERPEFAAFETLAEHHGFPLYAVDRKADADLRDLATLEPYDLLLSLNWRFLVPGLRLGHARLADLNLHRGALPGYEGAEPVRRMLADGIGYAEISVHHMTACYDQGEVVFAYRHPATIRAGETPRSAAERVKGELVPAYAACVFQAVNRLLQVRGEPPLDSRCSPV